MVGSAKSPAATRPLAPSCPPPAPAGPLARALAALAQGWAALVGKWQALCAAVVLWWFGPAPEPAPRPAMVDAQVGTDAADAVEPAAPTPETDAAAALAVQLADAEARNGALQRQALNKELGQAVLDNRHRQRLAQSQHEVRTLKDALAERDAEHEMLVQQMGAAKEAHDADHLKYKVHANRVRQALRQTKESLRQTKEDLRQERDISADLRLRLEDEDATPRASTIISAPSPEAPDAEVADLKAQLAQAQTDARAASRQLHMVRQEAAQAAETAQEAHARLADDVAFLQQQLAQKPAPRPASPIDAEPKAELTLSPMQGLVRPRPTPPQRLRRRPMPPATM